MTTDDKPTRPPVPLRDIPKKWARPPASMIGTIPVRGKDLAYMGHADVTLALIDCDELWSYSFLTKDDGTMNIVHRGDRLVIEGTLTVHGKTLPCVGTCQDTKHEPEKELLGDLLRNGAMRFGIATKLWSKL